MYAAELRADYVVGLADVGVELASTASGHDGSITEKSRVKMIGAGYSKAIKIVTTGA